jgi:hypothetical protein
MFGTGWLKRILQPNGENMRSSSVKACVLGEWLTAPTLQDSVTTLLVKTVDNSKLPLEPVFTAIELVSLESKLLDYVAVQLAYELESGLKKVKDCWPAVMDAENKFS